MLPSKTFLEAIWPLILFVGLIIIVAYPTLKGESKKHLKK